MKGLRFTNLTIRRFASSQKYHPSPHAYVAPSARKRDVIIIGGGHNGLVSAAYLAKAGLDVLVLERRHCVGGAAVTEEIEPGFKYSRGSYLAGLLRPQIIQDLELEKYGFKYLPRDPSSFTPTLESSIYKGKYLLLGASEEANYESIKQFSAKDAEEYPRYEEFLGKVRELIQPLLDNCPPDPTQGGLQERMAAMKTIKEVLKIGAKNREILVPFYELFVGPAQQILDRWFESDILKTTLATDAVIGAMMSPKQLGSAYVLLHHVMGEAAGKKGVWAYVEGGMGAVSEAIASCGREFGAEIVTNATVSELVVNQADKRVTGVRMEDGSVLKAKNIISGISPYSTVLELLDESNRQTLPADFVKQIQTTDFSCGAFKINCAIDKLPNFTCYPSPADGSAGPMHRGTIHFESHMNDIETAFREANRGQPATRPLIEMTIPSSLDTTVAPAGKHVAQLFIQYAPYDVDPAVGSWKDPVFKQKFVDRCFAIVEEYCPGFTASIISYDALSPLDLELIFGMHKGNIHHGSLGLHQLGYTRPAMNYSSHRSPLQGLYFGSCGSHPGGGVMGAAGRNCANILLSDLSQQKFFI